MLSIDVHVEIKHLKLKNFIDVIGKYPVRQVCLMVGLLVSKNQNKVIQ